MSTEVIESLRRFKERRDSLLHDDLDTFEHSLRRFMSFLERDDIAQRILMALSVPESVESWWESAKAGDIQFPDDPDEELALRYAILRDVNANFRRMWSFGLSFHKSKLAESIELFRELVVRPLVSDLSHRIGEAADLASPEARTLQAVPLSRIPPAGKSKVFISHRGQDKALAELFHRTLKELGYDPWFDDPELFAGSNLERAIKQGFIDSCAAVFLITENFADDRYLASEIDYAVQEKRKKGDRFAIIALRYPGAGAIPALLETYTYKNVDNDLVGLYEVIRALPIEPGPVRWRKTAVT